LPPTAREGREFEGPEKPDERAGAEPEPPFHYVIVRTDLSRGLQSAMLVHAAGESSPGGLPKNTHAVVLAAASEEVLAAVATRLKTAGISHVEIREPDAPFFGALMALGVLPGKKEVLRRHLSSLPLLR
jgi:hypothetical protein